MQENIFFYYIVSVGAAAAKIASLVLGRDKCVPHLFANEWKGDNVVQRALTVLQHLLGARVDLENIGGALWRQHHERAQASALLQRAEHPLVYARL